MKLYVLRAGLCLTMLTLPLAAQTEESLRAYFEGRNVIIKLDMPATKDGFDIYWRQNPPANMRTYTERLHQFGSSLRAGDSVMVTMVRVKGKNIEFQLGGGGYGTAGDDTGYVAMPSIPKSSREKDLERDIDKENERDRRDRMKRELARLRDQRESEERRARARARELEDRKRAEIQARRLQAGSRFNIWFPDGRLKEAPPTPNELMRILEPWVDFRAIPAPRAPVYAEPPPPPVPAGARVTRGMSVDQVHRILGEPVRRRDARQGDLDSLVENWETSEERIEVVFVGGLVVKYSTTSR